MPFRQSRRTRLALIAFLFLFAFVAGPTFARPPYEMNNATEGDPGDGVLSPRSKDPVSDYEPPTGGTTIAVPVGDSVLDRPAPYIWRFPLAIHVPVTGWITVAPLWLFIEGRWNHAP